MTDDRDKRPRRPERARPSGRAERQQPESERPNWQQLVERTRDPNREKSPVIPDAITPEDVDLGVRVQLKRSHLKTQRWLQDTLQW